MDLVFVIRTIIIGELIYDNGEEDIIEGSENYIN